MARMIEYWVLSRHHYALATGFAEYYRLSASGNLSPTDNPKLAMRWLTKEGAEVYADRLGWPWHVQRLEIDGSSIAGK